MIKQHSSKYLLLCSAEETHTGLEHLKVSEIFFFFENCPFKSSQTAGIKWIVVILLYSVNAQFVPSNFVYRERESVESFLYII